MCGASMNVRLRPRNSHVTPPHGLMGQSDLHQARHPVLHRIGEVPSNSVKRTRYGRPTRPGRRCAVHLCQTGRTGLLVEDVIDVVTDCLVGLALAGLGPQPPRLSRLRPAGRKAGPNAHSRQRGPLGRRPNAQADSLRRRAGARRRRADDFDRLGFGRRALSATRPPPASAPCSGPAAQDRRRDGAHGGRQQGVLGRHAAPGLVQPPQVHRRQVQVEHQHRHQLRCGAVIEPQCASWS